MTADIRRQLEKVLDDQRFRSSRRASQFLSFVVEKALAGETEEIKETVVAAEIYRRPSDYDPKADSLVRVEAGRLRGKLDEYYRTNGAQDPIRIRIPKGGYVPSFEPVEAPATPRNKRSKLWAFAAIVLVAVVIAGWRATALNAAPTPDAVAAWREAVALIEQDPLTGATAEGLPEPLRRSMERLEYAVARAPRFAAAWASLGESFDYAASFVGRDAAADGRRAESAARRAIELDPRSARGHAVLAAVAFGLKWDFAEAEREYRRAIQLEPGNAQVLGEYADLLRVLRRPNEALETIARARRDFPLSAALAAKHAEVLAAMGDGEAAQSAGEAAVRLKRGYRRAHIALGLAYESRELWSQAAAEYEAALRVYPDDRRALPAYGYVLGRLGRTEEARHVASRIFELHRRVRNMSYQLAVVHIGLGDRPAAQHWLEAAAATRHRMMPFAAVDPRLQSLPQVSGSGTGDPTIGEGRSGGL
ncbi:MAG: tetratricopeptide repeat protein [Bryobacteraceae bacterium]|nr:tetratricopeptide repeat protein [Bryobacteraceae bacterium]